MSAGGNVPTQGFAVQEVTTARKRGDRSMGHPSNYVGKGTPGRNLKRRHRRDFKPTKPHYVGLREYAQRLTKTDLEGASERLLEDVSFAEKWLEGKA